jgi:hypothetical protein
MHLTAISLRDSAINDEDFRSTMHPSVDGVCSGIDGVVCGHDLMTLGVGSLLSDQGPATLSTSIVADGSQQ